MEPFLGDCKHDVDQDRNPYLRLHRILGISEERLDPQALLVSPKEESDLPPLLVEEGDAFRRTGKIVGYENQFLLVFDVEKSDAMGLSW